MTTLPQKSRFVRVGDFFFRTRNLLFPVVIAVVFVGYLPPFQYFQSRMLEDWKDGIAVAIVLAGLSLRAAVIGYAYIKRGGLNKRVYAENLVTEGFFAVCRNPLYCGNMLIYTGVFLMHGNPLVMVLGPLVMFGIYASIIAAEEYFLRHEFAEAYARYCADVPRWIPRFSALPAALEGMTFNFKKVLVKDYSTVASTTLVLLFVEMLETWNETRFPLTHPPIDLVAAIASVLLIALGIAVAKRRGILRA